jgi:hypothetical protein
MIFKQKNTFNKDLTPFENMELQRKLHEKRSHQRYITQRILYFIRLSGLIALGIWGYLTRDTIYNFILDKFTNPKL